MPQQLDRALAAWAYRPGVYALRDGGTRYEPCEPGDPNRRARERKPTPTVLASDAEREAAVIQLRTAGEDGRLTTEELEDRVGKTLSSRTREQIAGLLADLPKSPTRPPESQRPSSRGWDPLASPYGRFLFGLLLLLVVFPALLHAVVGGFS